MQQCVKEDLSETANEIPFPGADHSAPFHTRKELNIYLSGLIRTLKFMYSLILVS